MVGGADGVGGTTGSGVGGMTGAGMGGMFGGMSGWGGMPGNSLVALMVGRIRAVASRSPRNTICASRPTTNAHWPRPPAPFAAGRRAHVPPAIGAR